MESDEEDSRCIVLSTGNPLTPKGPQNGKKEYEEGDKDKSLDFSDH